MAIKWEKTGLQWRYFHIFCSYVLPRILGTCNVLGTLEMKKIRVLMGFDS